MAHLSANTFSERLDKDVGAFLRSWRRDFFIDLLTLE
jgi:hypothetical protein